jgi:hypothetical protein
MGVVMWVVPAVIVVALIVLGMRAFARRLYARRLAFDQELISTGAEATATVTNVSRGSSGRTRSNGVWGRIAFTSSPDPPLALPGGEC